MNEFLKAELWEIQCILYWILAFLLIHFSNNSFLHDLGYFLTGWAFFTLYGVLVMLTQARNKQNAV